jgi:hypothetical protein
MSFCVYVLWFIPEFKMILWLFTFCDPFGFLCVVYQMFWLEIIEAENLWIVFPNWSGFNVLRPELLIFLFKIFPIQSLSADVWRVSSLETSQLMKHSRNKRELIDLSCINALKFPHALSEKCSNAFNKLSESDAYCTLSTLLCASIKIQHKKLQNFITVECLKGIESHWTSFSFEREN